MVIRKELLPILVRETAIRANELARSLDPAYTGSFAVSDCVAGVNTLDSKRAIKGCKREMYP